MTAAGQMNILVIKQTSLGDVLHSTGHIRTIKENFPHCRLTVLTAAGSADIYRHNPRVDEMILFEHRRVKRECWRHPVRTARYIAGVISRVRATRFELAFDLQGLARSVVFLYAARAGKKYVKGRWPGLGRFRNPALHAIAEMDGVLGQARLSIADTSMEFFTGAAERQYIDDLLAQINPARKPLLVFSPFSRWNSKDWPLPRYVEIAARLADECVVVFTGSAVVRGRIEQALSGDDDTGPVNLAGELTIPQFAELAGRATLMLAGDSFPMHLACAQNTPVVALFGPTLESKTGPLGAAHEVIRAPDCARCDRPDCRRHCLGKLSTDAVFRVLRARLEVARAARDTR